MTLAAALENSKATINEFELEVVEAEREAVQYLREATGLEAQLLQARAKHQTLKLLGALQVGMNSQIGEAEAGLKKKIHDLKKSAKAAFGRCARGRAALSASREEKECIEKLQALFVRMERANANAVVARRKAVATATTNMAKQV